MCIPKPSNRLFCPQCGKFKLQFETERKALMHLEYNSDSFNDKRPVRVYYCTACCAFHTTSNINFDKIKDNYNIYEHIDSIASKYHFNKLSLERKNRIDNIFNRITA